MEKGARSSLFLLMSKDKTAIFIDGGYLDKILAVEYGMARLDYPKFIGDLVGVHDLLRTYYYHCMPYRSNPPTADEDKRYSQKQRFFSTLEKMNRFQMRFGKLAKRANGTFEQKRVDVLMAVDLVRLSWSNKISRATIITGDSDFVPAIEDAKNAGVSIILYYHPNSINDELLKVCDERIVITPDMVKRNLRPANAAGI